MRRVRRFQVAQYHCLVIKYARDTRYSDTGMATHDKWAPAFTFCLLRWTFGVVDWFSPVCVADVETL